MHVIINTIFDTFELKNIFLEKRCQIYFLHLFRIHKNIFLFFIIIVLITFAIICDVSHDFFLVIVYFTLGKKHPVMVIDGYEFKLLQRTSLSSVWVCTQNVKHRCRVRLMTTGRQIQMKPYQHTHPQTFKGHVNFLRSQTFSLIYREKFVVSPYMEYKK